MPEISRFYGIVIFINYRDHNPPHFHARYGEHEIIIQIQTGTVEGKMNKRALKMIFEWYEQHQEEMIDNWERARQGLPLHPIPPLD